MLHKGTIIVTTLLIALAVFAFVVEPLVNDFPASQRAAVTETTTPLPPNTEDAQPDEMRNSLPLFTSEILAKYDGSDPSLPIYIAFEGNVYDVTPGKSYYEPGGTYHFLAGSDGTALLSVIGGDIIKKKYSVVGTMRDDTVSP